MDFIAKPEFSFVDEALVKGFTSNKKLTVFLSRDGFSYTISKSSSAEVLAHEIFLFQNPPADINSNRELCDILGRSFDKTEWLNKKYSSNNFIFRGHQATLIPSSLFDAENTAGYLKFNYPLTADAEVRQEEVKNAGARLIYSIPSCLARVIESHFGNYVLHPYMNSLLKFAFPEARSYKKEAFIGIDVHPTMFYLYVIRDNQLVFANSFQYHTHEDLIYYSMFSLKQLEIRASESMLNITGRVRKDSVLIESVKRYFKDAKILRTSANKVLLDRVEQETGFAPQILLF